MKSQPIQEPSQNTAADAGRPIRIGFYLPGITGSGSGSWTRIRDLARWLSGRDDVVVFAAIYDSVSIPDFRIPSERIAVVPRAHPLQRLRATSVQVRNFVQRFELDLVQVEVLPVPRAVGCPILLSIHDLRHFNLRGWDSVAAAAYSRLLLRRHLSGVAGLLALSRWAGDGISERLQFPSSLVHVVPPITPDVPATGGSVPARLQVLSERSFVLSVGHLEPRKNLEVIVRATQQPDWPADLIFVIAGKDHGSEKQLRKLAARSPRAVRFLGPVNDVEKWWLLQNAEIVGLPSRLEGFGIVALEAIAAGTVLLVGDSSALPELVEGTDSVVALDDPSAWSKRIRSLHSDLGERAGLAQQQSKLLAVTDGQAVTNRLIRLYGETIGR